MIDVRAAERHWSHQLDQRDFETLTRTRVLNKRCAVIGTDSHELIDRPPSVTKRSAPSYRQVPKDRHRSRTFPDRSFSPVQ